MIYCVDGISASNSTKRGWEDELRASLFPLTLLAVIHPHGEIHKP